MSDFTVKMHQIRFPLGLRPRPCWGSLQRSPRLLTVFKGPTSKGREGAGETKGRGGEGKRWEREGMGGKWREEGKRREGGREGNEGVHLTHFLF